MENGMIIGVLALIMGYFLFKFLSKKQSNSEHAQKSTISDILTKDKYKVKSQWDK